MTNPTTKSTPFARCDHVDHHLFAVQPDIPLLDALEHAAVYLSCAEALAHQAPTASRPEHKASLRWASSKCLVLRAHWCRHPLTGCTRSKLERCMNPHMPMTNNDCDIPVLLVATQAPLDVLHSNAATRFLAVTQMMESLASLDITQAKGADVQQLAHAAAMLLRDGCDVMDVLGRRIRAQL